MLGLPIALERRATCDHIKEDLVASGQKLDQMLGYKNRQAQVKQALTALQIEGKYFKQYNGQSDMKGPKPYHVERRLSL